MNLLTADKIEQTGAIRFEKLVTWIIISFLTNLCDDSWRWDCIFIYVFQTFEDRTRANQADITGLGAIDLWHAARLAQLGERRSAEREVASSNPGRTNTQGLKNNWGESAVFVMTSAND